MKIKNLTGPQIRFYRKQRRWTQQTLANTLQATGVVITRQMIANIETQRCSVSDCQIASIAKVLQIPIVLFFSDEVLAEFTGVLEIHPRSRNVGNLPLQNRLARPARGISGLIRRLFGKH